jgi:hypothetical protein
MLMRRLAQQGAAVIGIARHRGGRVLKIDVMRRAVVRGGSAPTAGVQPLTVPMLHN